ETRAPRGVTGAIGPVASARIVVDANAEPAAQANIRDANVNVLRLPEEGAVLSVAADGEVRNVDIRSAPRVDRTPVRAARRVDDSDRRTDVEHRVAEHAKLLIRRNRPVAREENLAL